MSVMRPHRPTDLVLVAWMFVLLPLIDSSQSACPSRCSCDVTRHVVACQNAALRHVPWNLPIPMELNSLDLSHNEIGEINAQITYSNLKLLDLSNNRIKSISEDILRDLPHLEVLYLKGNHLSALQANVFDGMVSLRHLDLSNNQLLDLHLPLFDGLRSLEELNLAGNDMDNISSLAFQSLDTLHYLNLEDNNLRDLQPNAFSLLTSLKTLNLGYNKLETLPHGAFSQLLQLRELNLQANQLTELPAKIFIADSRLEKLDLRNNHLDHVPSSALSSRLTSLEALDLSQNPLVQIPEAAFRGLGQLRSIQLNTMPDLEVVHMGAFLDLGNLQELEMHSNHKLGQIQEGAFRGMPQLRKLDLHANYLDTLHSGLLDWSELKVLDLRYNPWRCDCRLAWLPWVLKQQATNSTAYITQEVRCASPDDQKGTLVVATGNGNSECLEDLVTVAMKPQKFNDHIMISIMCTIGGILVVVIVILMCKYGKSYSTAYAPAMDQYVYRNPSKMADMDSDIERQTVPVIEGDMTMARNLRSSLSSASGIGAPAKSERRLYRVRFADGNQSGSDKSSDKS